MDVKIKRPTEVREQIAKAYSTAAQYSDLLSMYDKELITLEMEIEQFATELQRRQREHMICVDSIKSTYSKENNSQEAENQLKEHIAQIEMCRRKQEALRNLNEELAPLIRELKKLQQDAAGMAERLKRPSLMVRMVIEKYLSCL